MKDLVSQNLLIYIKINAVSPPVIILKINDIKNSTNLSYKPPPAACFYPLLDDSFIGCASSSVYDIVAFLSVVSDVNNKLVLATKIKQRWKISCMNALIDNDEKLAKLLLILATNTNSIDENNATAVSTSTSIQFNQPISVRLLNKCTNKLTVGSFRSLKIVPQ
ncbi:unnamed protein product [Rotaria magnacalcarata]